MEKHLRPILTHDHIVATINRHSASVTRACQATACVAPGSPPPPGPYRIPDPNAPARHRSSARQHEGPGAWWACPAPDAPPTEPLTPRTSWAGVSGFEITEPPGGAGPTQVPVGGGGCPAALAGWLLLVG